MYIIHSKSGYRSFNTFWLIDRVARQTYKQTISRCRYNLALQSTGYRQHDSRARPRGPHHSDSNVNSAVNKTWHSRPTSCSNTDMLVSRHLATYSSLAVRPLYRRGASACLDLEPRGQDFNNRLTDKKWWRTKLGVPVPWLVPVSDVSVSYSLVLSAHKHNKKHSENANLSRHSCNPNLTNSDPHYRLHLISSCWSHTASLNTSSKFINVFSVSLMPTDRQTVRRTNRQTPGRRT